MDCSRLLHDILKEITDTNSHVHKEVDISMPKRNLLGISFHNYCSSILDGGSFGMVFSCQWNGEDAVMKLVNGNPNVFLKEISLLR